MKHAGADGDAFQDWRTAINHRRMSSLRTRRSKRFIAGAALTLAWLIGGSIWFVRWQSGEAPGQPARDLIWPALEAALLVALVFWVLAGIAYGIVRWIVTGRGPQA
jgi:hypothetical protein